MQRREFLIRSATSLGAAWLTSKDVLAALEKNKKGAADGRSILSIVWETETDAPELMKKKAMDYRLRIDNSNIRL